MPAVAIYRVSVTGDNHSYVQWTECEGNTPPPQLINSRLRTIVFEAQGTGITPGVNCSISKSSAATIEIIGVANSNCSGTGNNESLTTTTTIPITTTAAPTTTTTLAPVTISLGYNVSDYKVAYDNYSREISLPIFYDLSDEQIKIVVNAVIQALDKVVS